MTTKLADSKGRVTLGRDFANCMLIIDDDNPDQIIIKRAVAIPTKEAWLYENEEAVGSVRRGLAQARAQTFSAKPPDLEADAELARDE